MTCPELADLMAELGVLSIILPELHAFLATDEGHRRWRAWAP